MQDLTFSDGSWASDLPDSIPLDGAQVTEESTDATEIRNPPANACTVCGLTIERVPGSRGRLPKTHPECKPSGKSTKTGTSAPRAVRVTKKDEQAAVDTAIIIDRVAGMFQKAIVLLSLADPYDAFVVKVNAPDILSNLESILLRNEKVRSFMTTAETGGSILGLIIALGSTGLPIAAHHGLVPKGKIAELILQAPYLAYKMQNVETGEDFDKELLRRIQENTRRAKEAQMRKASMDGYSSERTE